MLTVKSICYYHPRSDLWFAFRNRLCAWLYIGCVGVGPTPLKAHQDRIAVVQRAMRQPPSIKYQNKVTP